LTEPSQTIGEGQSLTWRLCGTDADMPPNSLTYLKLGGATNFTVAASGEVSWSPATVGTYALTVKLTDNNPAAVNAKQLSTTNTFTITVVPTNTLYLYSLKVRQLSPGTLEFTVLDGRADNDYVLQSTPALFSCPPTNPWQDRVTIKATEMPFAFR